MTVKLSDYIVQKLEQLGLRQAFMVSGGGAMHLNDSFGKSRLIRLTCCHHEQACAIAAEGYARVNGRPAVVNVTTGPGGINCLNGVFGQWTDSVPALYISGQVKFSTTAASCPQIPLRQLGDQEADIVSLVRPITKYARMVTDPLDVDAALEEAVFHALSGRPGPVWLDIPMNVQSAQINPADLRRKTFSFRPPRAYQKDLPEILRRLQTAKRPLAVVGHGVRLAGAQEELEQFLQAAQIPAVSTYNGFDLLPDASPYYAGRVGTVGTRAGNFALQNADLVLFLGTRNNIRQVSYNWENFAKNAFKIIVDIDAAELEKPTVRPDLPVHADVKDFLARLNALRPKTAPDANWLPWCRERVAKYPPLKEFSVRSSGPINAYDFCRKLTQALPPGAVLAGANGTCCLGLFQAGEIRPGRRVLLNSGCASMGYGLPAAVGACLAAPGRPAACLEGDGSLMMNLQELQTVVQEKLPLKIFLLNNNGYISIRQTQQRFFEGRLTACSPESGVTLPDFTRVAKAFGLPSARLASARGLADKLQKILQTPGPVFCEVVTEDDYAFAPKLSARVLPDGSMRSPSLEDMAPFLSKEELAENIFKGETDER